MEFCFLTRQCEPGYLRDVGRVVRPGPETEGPSVLAVQRWLLYVIQVTGPCDSPFGDPLVPGLKWDTLQAKPHMVLEVADVTMCEQLPRPGVDVKVAVVESP